MYIKICGETLDPGKHVSLLAMISVPREQISLVKYVRGHTFLRETHITVTRVPPLQPYENDNFDLAITLNTSSVDAIVCVATIAHSQWKSLVTWTDLSNGHIAY